eukprot:TRINITY_DN7917_c0_g1_i1.p1 TRINITY_DN7917_c0_g1~~TRINITY_DN7917_c0_g1_i1.p1  ORF type:complete len:932 (+),score=124.36 TRINITY_DN7917_c0_g1_i1:2-2797(+)
MNRNPAEQKAFSGAKAEGKDVRSSAGFGSYFQNIASYVPTGMKWSSSSTSSETEKIIWGSFDYLETGQEKRLCLILVYTVGFQIWDLEDSTNFREIASRREESVKSVKFLKVPTGASNQDPWTLSPLISIITTGQNNEMKLYSLLTQQFLSKTRYRYEIIDILPSKDYFAVVFPTQMYIFEGLQKRCELDIYPINGQLCPASAGPRWIAYPINELVPPPQDNYSFNSNGSFQFADVASSIYYLGDMGVKTVSNYFANEPKSLSEEKFPGNVVVYDVQSKARIAHFQAHSLPISYLQFDPTGSLLATCSEDGYSIHVYQVSPESCNHIFKLNRGMTTATIQHISFSFDSFWLTATSTRGTTHVFAICPGKMNPTIDTHARTGMEGPELSQIFKFQSLEAPACFISSGIAVQNNWDMSISNSCSLNNSLSFPEQPSQTPENNSKDSPINLTVRERIKQNLVVKSPEDPTNKVLPPASVTFQNSNGQPSLLLLSQVGKIMKFRLHPHGPPKTAVDQKELQLSVYPVKEWEINRKLTWPEVRSPVPLHPQNNGGREKAQNEGDWRGQVEIHFNDARYRALCTRPNWFRFTKLMGEPDANGEFIGVPLVTPVHSKKKPPSTAVRNSKVNSQQPESHANGPRGQSQSQSQSQSQNQIAPVSVSVPAPVQPVALRTLEPAFIAPEKTPVPVILDHSLPPPHQTRTITLPSSVITVAHEPTHTYQLYNLPTVLAPVPVPALYVNRSAATYNEPEPKPEIAPYTLPTTTTTTTTSTNTASAPAPRPYESATRPPYQHQELPTVQQHFSSDDDDYDENDTDLSSPQRINRIGTNNVNWGESVDLGSSFPTNQPTQTHHDQDYQVHHHDQEPIQISPYPPNRFGSSSSSGSNSPDNSGFYRDDTRENHIYVSQVEEDPLSHLEPPPPREDEYDFAPVPQDDD